MVVILPILLERQWRWPSTILSGEPLFYLEPLLIRLFSALFSGPPPLIRGGGVSLGKQQLQAPIYDYIASGFRRFMAVAA